MEGEARQAAAPNTTSAMTPALNGAAPTIHDGRTDQRRCAGSMLRHSNNPTAIQTANRIGPDQIRNASGTGTGSQGSSVRIKSVSGARDAPIHIIAATMATTAATKIKLNDERGRSPSRSPATDAKLTVPSDSHAQTPETPARPSL